LLKCGLEGNDSLVLYAITSSLEESSLPQPSAGEAGSSKTLRVTHCHNPEYYILIFLQFERLVSQTSTPVNKMYNRTAVLQMLHDMTKQNTYLSTTFY